MGDTVRFYITYAASGENVSMRGFGSFIIKTRAEKKGRNINKNTAITSNGDGDGEDNGGGTTPPINDERPASGDGDGGNDDIPTPSFHTDELDY
ncbi:MAG: HU family DNA-binding protein [Bacteroidales bacterium]|nr:HU family DNA-binding protein [Bacteroidales bacterium]